MTCQGSQGTSRGDCSLMSRALRQASTLQFPLNAARFCCFTGFCFALWHHEALALYSSCHLYPLIQEFLPVATASLAACLASNVWGKHRSLSMSSRGTWHSTSEWLYGTPTFNTFIDTMSCISKSFGFWSREKKKNPPLLCLSTSPHRSSAGLFKVNGKTGWVVVLDPNTAVSGRYRASMSTTDDPFTDRQEILMSVQILRVTHWSVLAIMTSLWAHLAAWLWTPSRTVRKAV